MQISLKISMSGLIFRAQTKISVTVTVTVAANVSYASSNDHDPIIE